MERENSFPFHFDSNACKTCGGKCCRGHQGYVWISTEELEAMAGAGKMDVILFTRQYVREVQGRLSLQERVVNGEHLCCFFDRIAGKCTFYESRPEQCRTFPFWISHAKQPRDLLDECPGVSLKEEGELLK